MDFNYRKPLHILALILILLSFIVIIVLPIYSFFNTAFSTQSGQYAELAEELTFLLEIFILVFQLVFALIFFIIFPLLWYVFVNAISFKKTFSKIRITANNIDIAFLDMSENYKIDLGNIHAEIKY